MNEEIRLMEASHKFEISRIKSQMLADVTIRILDKYDFVTKREVEEIAAKARYLVLLAFNEKRRRGMSQYGDYKPKFEIKMCATCIRKFCILRWFGCFNKFWKGGEK